MLDCCRCCANGPEASEGPPNLLLPRPIVFTCDGSPWSRGSSNDVLRGYHRSIDGGELLREADPARRRPIQLDDNLRYCTATDHNDKNQELLPDTSSLDTGTGSSPGVERYIY